MNKVKFGLCNVHIAKITLGENNTYTYGTPFALPGAINLSLATAGEQADLHADNVLYFSDSANNGYEGDLELAMVTDEFREQILGETVDANGAYIESANDTISPFAIGFQINGDSQNRRFWYYNATVSRPDNNSKTTETSKEPSTDTLSIKTMPRLSDNKVRVFMTKSDTNTTAYNAFFESVYETQASV